MVSFCVQKQSILDPSSAHQVGGRMVRSPLQLSDRWAYHIWRVDRMRFASIEANLNGGVGCLGALSLFHSSLGVTEIL